MGSEPIAASNAVDVQPRGFSSGSWLPASFMNAATVDIAIIGGGIVGLGTALALTERFPGYSLAVLEKEPELAAHQTGRNSGVVHAGIYYKTGSAKARLCVEGVRLLTEFCREHKVAIDRCGKIIVAVSDEELPRLQELYERGKANGVPGLEILSPERARELEPEVRKELLRLVVAVARNDIETIVECFYRLRMVEPQINTAVLRDAARTLMGISLGTTFSPRRIQEISEDIYNTFHRFPVRLPESLVYLLRASALIEGIGISFDPHFNGVRAARPMPP